MPFAKDTEKAVVHFTVYLIGVLCILGIYYNYVILEAYFYALFWALIFSIPLFQIKVAILNLLPLHDLHDDEVQHISSRISPTHKPQTSGHSDCEDQLFYPNGNNTFHGFLTSNRLQDLDRSHPFTANTTRPVPEDSFYSAKSSVSESVTSSRSVSPFVSLGAYAFNSSLRTAPSSTPISPLSPRRVPVESQAAASLLSCLTDSDKKEGPCSTAALDKINNTVQSAVLIYRLPVPQYYPSLPSSSLTSCSKYGKQVATRKSLVVRSAFAFIRFLFKPFRQLLTGPAQSASVGASTPRKNNGKSPLGNNRGSRCANAEKPITEKHPGSQLPYCLSSNQYHNASDASSMGYSSEDTKRCGANFSQRKHANTKSRTEDFACSQPYFGLLYRCGFVLCCYRLYLEYSAVFYTLVLGSTVSSIIRQLSRSMNSLLAVLLIISSLIVASLICAFFVFQFYQESNLIWETTHRYVSEHINERFNGIYPWDATAAFWKPELIDPWIAFITATDTNKETKYKNSDQMAASLDKAVKSPSLPSAASILRFIGDRPGNTSGTEEINTNNTSKTASASDNVISKDSSKKCLGTRGSTTATCYNNNNTVSDFHRNRRSNGNDSDNGIIYMKYNADNSITNYYDIGGINNTSAIIDDNENTVPTQTDPHDYTSVSTTASLRPYTTPPSSKSSDSSSHTSTSTHSSSLLKLFRDDYFEHFLKLFEMYKNQRLFGVELVRYAELWQGLMALFPQPQPPATSSAQQNNNIASMSSIIATGNGGSSVSVKPSESGEQNMCIIGNYLYADVEHAYFNGSYDNACYADGSEAPHFPSAGSAHPLSFVFSSSYAANSTDSAKASWSASSFKNMFGRVSPSAFDLLGQLKHGNISALAHFGQTCGEMSKVLLEDTTIEFRDSLNNMRLYASSAVKGLFSSSLSLFRVLLLAIVILFKFVLSAFDIILQAVVFFSGLYYLLCSEISFLEYVEEILSLVDPSGIVFNSIDRGLRAILLSSVKRMFFYSLFTYVSFSWCSLPIVFVPTAVSSLLALLPLFPPETISIFAIAYLWLYQQRVTLAIILLTVNLLVYWYVTTAIYMEIPDSNPWLVGLSVVLGISTFGLKGIIFGPLLASIPLILYNIASRYNERKRRQLEYKLRFKSTRSQRIMHHHKRIKTYKTEGWGTRFTS